MSQDAGLKKRGVKLNEKISSQIKLNRVEKKLQILEELTNIRFQFEKISINLQEELFSDYFKKVENEEKSIMNLKSALKEDMEQYLDGE